MEKLVDRIEGIGGEYLWEELGDAIPGPILQFLADLGAKIGEGERGAWRGAGWERKRGREEVGWVGARPNR